MPIPTDIADLVLWLDADDLTGTLADNAAVATWPDASGLGNDVVQTLVGNRPTFQLNEINSLPAVRFLGVPNDSHMDIPNIFSGATSGEIFAVLRNVEDPPASGNNTGIWLFGTAASSDHHPWVDGVIYTGFGSTVRKTTTNPTQSLVEWHRVNVSSASGAFTYRINETTHFTTATNTVAWSTAPKLGRSFAAFYFGDMASVIAYSRTLTTQERTDVSDFLVDRFFTAAEGPSTELIADTALPFS